MWFRPLKGMPPKQSHTTLVGLQIQSVCACHHILHCTHEVFLFHILFFVDHVLSVESAGMNIVSLWS